jgi:hypothetical protein
LGHERDEIVGNVMSQYLIDRSRRMMPSGRVTGEDRQGNTIISSALIGTLTGRVGGLMLRLLNADDFRRRPDGIRPHETP